MYYVFVVALFQPMFATRFTLALCIYVIWFELDKYEGDRILGSILCIF